MKKLNDGLKRILSDTKQYVQEYSMVFALILLIFLVVITLITVVKNNMGFNKSYWDWMELLLIPLGLAIAGYWFTTIQASINLENAKKERDVDREIASERQQQNILDNYFDKMTDLILNEELITTETESIKNLARARTHNTLGELESKRNQQIIRFLRDNNLSLFTEANLSGTDLSGVNLSGANLVGANLSGANLSGADLSEADLVGADLVGANLNDANLYDANLSKANLNDANLSNAFLIGTTLFHANLSRTDLSGANLSSANLSRAILI